MILRSYGRPIPAEVDAIHESNTLPPGSEVQEGVRQVSGAAVGVLLYVDLPPAIVTNNQNLGSQKTIEAIRENL